MDESDNVLVARYRAGDKEAFEALVRRYIQSVYHYALRYAWNIAGAEDIAQETFVKVWRHLATFDETQNFSERKSYKLKRRISTAPQDQAYTSF